MSPSPSHATHARSQSPSQSQSPTLPSHAHCPSSTHDVATHDVAKRIAKVQEAMHELLALYQPPPLHSKSNAAPDAPTMPSTQNTLVGTPGNPPAHPTEGETRCYYFSPSALRQERLLLGKYGANNLHELIAEAHVLLVGLVKVMKSTHPDARLRGYAISSLGTLLEQASSLMHRMRNVYSAIEQIPL